jgi:hypothetical protein
MFLLSVKDVIFITLETYTRGFKNLLCCGNFTNQNPDCCLENHAKRIENVVEFVRRLKVRIGKTFNCSTKIMLNAMALLI